MGEEKTVVDRLYEEFEDLIKYLDESSPIYVLHFHSTAGENFKKIILLAAASYFEDCITKSILEFVDEISDSQENKLMAEFLKNKAISRQYHTYFDWKGKNANMFFGLFGDSFKKFMEQEIKNDSKLSESIKKFIEIGRFRNKLVHENFAAFTFDREKTPEEIYEDYKEALYFVESIPIKLREFCKINDK